MVMSIIYRGFEILNSGREVKVLYGDKRLLFLTDTLEKANLIIDAILQTNIKEILKLKTETKYIKL